MGMTVLLLLFLEIASLLIVGSWIGVGWTLLLLIGGFVLGLALIGRGGREAMSAVNQAARSRQVAGDTAVTGGFLTVVAGVLLMIPGFVSDLAALALLLPPVRTLVRRRMLAWAERSSAQVRVVHLGGAAPGMWAAAHQGARVGGPVVDGSVVDGTVVDVTPDDRPYPANSGAAVERRPGGRTLG